MSGIATENLVVMRGGAALLDDLTLSLGPTGSVAIIGPNGAGKSTLLRTLAGIEVPSSWYQAANPIFVIVLAPLFAVLWTRLGDRQPSSPMKFTLGLFFLALAFSLMIPAARLAVAGRVSPLWLLGLYFLQTVGEMCLSPVGLSTFTKLSPRHLVGAMLGIWYLGAAFGNKFAGVLAANFGEGDAQNLAGFFGRVRGEQSGVPADVDYRAVPGVYPAAGLYDDKSKTP